jgi:hypothetical protein
VLLLVGNDRVDVIGGGQAMIHDCLSLAGCSR